MKNTSFPSVRVDAELRRAAESVLMDGESMSSFVEHSIRRCINSRRLQKEFLERGLASRDEAKRTGEYYSANEIQDEMDRMLNEARARYPAQR